MSDSLLDDVLVEPHGEWSAPVTLRAYLRELLVTLWAQGDDFSAKRPLGYSDWQWPVYAALATAGYLGVRDAADELDATEVRAANRLVTQAVERLFGGG